MLDFLLALFSVGAVAFMGWIVYRLRIKRPPPPPPPPDILL